MPVPHQRQPGNPEASALLDFFQVEVKRLSDHFGCDPAHQVMREWVLTHGEFRLSQAWIVPIPGKSRNNRGLRITLGGYLWKLEIWGEWGRLTYETTTLAPERVTTLLDSAFCILAADS